MNKLPVLLALTAACLIDPILSAAQPDPREPAVIQKELEETQARIAALEREAVLADQRAAEAQQLTELRMQAADRIKAYKDELAELAKPPESPMTPAQHAQREARVTFINTCVSLDEKVTKLDGAAALPEAKSLLLAREIAEARWAIVTSPTIDRATRIESLEPAAQESKKVRDLAARLQRLHEQDIKDAEAEFAAHQQRMKAAAEMEKLFEEAAEGE